METEGSTTTETAQGTLWDDLGSRRATEATAMADEEDKGRWQGISTAERGQGGRGLKEDEEEFKVTCSDRRGTHWREGSTVEMTTSFGDDEGNGEARFFQGQRGKHRIERDDANSKVGTVQKKKLRWWQNV